MRTNHAEELLGRLRTESVDRGDLAALERTQPADLIAELASDCPLRFQERQHRDKWEVGLARSLRCELASRVVHWSFFPFLALIPVLRRYLFLSGEGDRVRGLAIAAGPIVRPSQRSFRKLVLTTGRGFKVELSSDGWAVKPVRRRTVQLTVEFLRQRGWQFDLFRQFLPRN